MATCLQLVVVELDEARSDGVLAVLELTQEGVELSDAARCETRHVCAARHCERLTRTCTLKSRGPNE